MNLIEITKGYESKQNEQTEQTNKLRMKERLLLKRRLNT